MRKTLRELHLEIEPIMNLNDEDLKNTSKEDLLKYQKELKSNCKYVKAEKLRHIGRYNVQANAERRIVDIEIKIETINEILNDSQTNEKINHSNTHPFKDDETLKLFEYIIDNWNYKPDQKWADIWNELNTSEDYIAPFKNNYQTFIITKYKYTGKFQYDKIKSSENKNRIELLKIIESFSKKET